MKTKNIPFILAALASCATCSLFAEDVIADEATELIPTEYKLFSFNAFADIETAYICRGHVWDTRPYSAQYAAAEADLEKFGILEASIWTQSAMSGDGTSSRMTPYWRLRVIHKPIDETFWCIGVKRTFEIIDKLTFTIDFFGDLGDRRHYQNLYGPKAGGRDYRGGLKNLTLVGRLDYAIVEHVNIFAFVGQFCLVSDDARDAVKGMHVPERSETSPLAAWASPSNSRPHRHG